MALASVLLGRVNILPDPGPVVETTVWYQPLRRGVGRSERDHLRAAMSSERDHGRSSTGSERDHRRGGTTSE